MGNSGGPMFDLNGNVIGINSALISPTGASVGIGLAIPAEEAKPVIDALMRGQRPRAAISASSLQPVDDDIAPSLGHPEGQGEIVRSVVPGAPGALAGLQQGDVIVKVNGQQVTPDQTVSLPVANSAVGTKIPLEIIRGGKRATVTCPSAAADRGGSWQSSAAAASDRRQRRCDRRAGRAAARARPVARSR